MGNKFIVDGNVIKVLRADGLFLGVWNLKTGRGNLRDYNGLTRYTAWESWKDAAEHIS